jgi:hypothetical protein
MILKILIIFCIFSGGAFVPNTPKSIVDQYCKMDSLGYALSSDTFKKNMIHLVTEKSANIAPGWDVITIIKDYKIGKQITKKQKVFIPVRYHLLGVMDGNRHFEYKEESKVINYELILIKDEWKITKFSEPKVAIDTIINYLKNRLNSFSEDKDKEQVQTIKNTINDLNQLKIKIEK